MTPDPDNPPIREVPELSDFAQVRARPAVFVILQEAIELRHLLILRNEIDDRRFEELDLVIHSVGGDIHVAYQMVQLIRQHTRRMNACVPLYAKSAATLWCLAADRIVMDESAELGPLDVQIYEQRSGGGRYTSALNPFKALEQLQRESLQALDTAMNMVVKKSGLDMNECLTHAITFVQATTGMLFDKMDPEKLGEYSRALAIGTEYGQRLLRRYAEDWDDSTKSQILERFVRGYPSHEYIIDYAELSEMGIPVSLFSDDERAKVESLRQKILTGPSMVKLVEPPPLPTATRTEPTKPNEGES